MKRGLYILHHFLFLLHIVASISPISLDQEQPGRLLLASNRLPITIQRQKNGSYEFSMSSGGLATGLSGLSKSIVFKWYGWPGLEVPEAQAGPMTRQLYEEYNAVPIFIDDDLADKHYNGFSSKVHLGVWRMKMLTVKDSILWPLFHYQPREISFEESAWKAYVKVNRLFAKSIAKDAQDGDMIWVHDYHLMLLPQFLREELGNSKKKAKVGFFLHTPFPSSEMYRILPVREELLRSVLHSDLIGFHTQNYVKLFFSSCERILNLNTTSDSVEFHGRHVTVAAFPIGIDPDKFVQGLKKRVVQDRIAALKNKFHGVKLIIGIDRLDYIKGVPQKLHAFEVFLAENPSWVGKVVLIQVAIPSRQHVNEYQHLQAVVNELVGRINGRFGSFDFMPIHFLHKSISVDELTAIYAVSDVCLISSTRDGMNLVSYEYIATQRKRHGVIIISEFAGAAQSLTGALIVNPWSTGNLSGAIFDAITMGPEQRKANYKKLEKHVFKYTSEWWGKTFIYELSKCGG